MISYSAQFETWWTWGFYQRFKDNTLSLRKDRDGIVKDSGRNGVTSPHGGTPPRISGHYFSKTMVDMREILNLIFLISLGNS